VKPLYSTDVVAAALYWMVIIVWIVSEASAFFRGVTIAPDRRKDRSSGPILIGFLLLAVWLGGILASLVPGASMSAGRSVIFVCGLLLALAGIALRQYAIASLGRFFTVRVMTRPDQTVIESGPYRCIRHPSYSGSLMTVLGVLLCSTNWLALACFVLAVPGFLYRIRVEERALIDALGESYRAYMGRTKRLVPFVV
jgi:protein-S-isoprenylcysteine O-methyltransferase Ste14